MISPTPLQVLLATLHNIPIEETPMDARAVRRVLYQTTLDQRGHEVVAYLIDASDGKLGRRGSGGSLKHVLWWLRDNAGDLYVPAAKDVLRLALKGTWPLSNALPHLKQGRIAGQFVEAMAEPTNGQALLQYVQERHIGPWRVAVYDGTRNLLKPVMRAGFDVYVALSERGGVVKVRRGLAVDGNLFPGWKQVYPDLLILEEEWEGDINALLDLVPAAVRRK